MSGVESVERKDYDDGDAGVKPASGFRLSAAGRAKSEEHQPLRTLRLTKEIGSFYFGAVLDSGESESF
jgi:hypothetical protein